MEKEFIPYKLALELKELGFDEPSMMNHYGDKRLHVGRLYLPPSFGKGKNSEMHDDSLRDEDVTAVLYQQAFRWFREKYNLECYIKSLYEQRENKGFYFGIDDYTNRDFYSKPYYSYEEAELQCLKKLIEIVKNGKK